MEITQPTEPKWIKSSRSAETNCVEIARVDDAVLIRDSKNVDGGHLTVSMAAWQDFLDAVRRGFRC